MLCTRHPLHLLSQGHLGDAHRLYTRLVCCAKCSQTQIPRPFSHRLNQSRKMESFGNTISFDMMQVQAHSDTASLWSTQLSRTSSMRLCVNGIEKQAQIRRSCICLLTSTLSLQLSMHTLYWGRVRTVGLVIMLLCICRCMRVTNEKQTKCPYVWHRRTGDALRLYIHIYILK
jgi:hypothetical protein